MFVWPRWIHMGSLHVSHNLDCQKLPIIMGNHLKTISAKEPFFNYMYVKLLSEDLNLWSLSPTPYNYLYLWNDHHTKGARW